MEAIYKNVQNLPGFVFVSFKPLYSQKWLTCHLSP